MKMVGASNSFIRCPFVVEGLVLGIAGGGLAFLAQWGLYKALEAKVAQSLAISFVQIVPFTDVWAIVLIAFMAVGILVGAVGGVIAIRNYLKVSEKHEQKTCHIYTGDDPRAHHDTQPCADGDPGKRGGNGAVPRRGDCCDAAVCR